VSREPHEVESVGESHGIAASRDTFDAVLERLFETTPHEPRVPLTRGTAVDRYVVLGTLGMGGMGVVYTAYDPELDRKVALKLIRPNRSDEARATDAETRLLREAQAMARLSHPNVLAVYDVGRYEDEVFVTIELVEGCTLSEWQRAGSHSWLEVRDLFEQAGRGLAAAHAQGLVHRDFKPDNVLVGSDGRVRVADFGLARSVSHGADDIAAGDADADEEHGASPKSPLERPLTRRGAVVGTPAYMAPEQVRGELVGPLADQFSFCAAFFAMLYGAPPFATRADLLEGRMGALPPRSSVPAWLRQVVLRGLSADPAHRFPSMDALLAALGRRRTGRRWLWAAAALALCGAGIAGWLASREAPHCQAAGQHMASVWTGDRAAGLQRAFAATQLPYAAETAGLVRERLQAYAQSWVQAHTDACEATHVRGEQSAELLDLRMLCLQQRLAELNSLVALFLAADVQLVRNASSAVAQLPSLASCSDPGVLGGGREPPGTDEQKRAVEELQPVLGRVAALGNAGKFADGLALARDAVAKARAIGYAPLLAQALLELGIAQERMEKPKDAEETLHQAAAMATASGHREVRVRAWNELVNTIGHDLAREREGRQAAEHAFAALRRLGGGKIASLQAAYLHNYLGQMWFTFGKMGEALDHYQRALALREKVLGPDHMVVAQSLNGLSVVYSQRGELASARAHLTRALAIIEKTFGSQHPNVAVSLGNLAVIHLQLGKYGEALRHSDRAVNLHEKLDPRGALLATALTGRGNILELLGRHEDAVADHSRALAILERTVGPKHPQYALVLGNLGTQLVLTGRLVEGLRAQERAVAIFRHRLGPDHPLVGGALDDLGDALMAVGRLDEALSAHERALAVNTKANGAAHPAVAVSHHGMGEVLLRKRQPGPALRSFERALPIREKKLGDKHPLFAATLLGMGEARLAQGEAALATPLLERAHGILRATPCSPLTLGRAGFLLARSLWDARERTRARAVAEGAQALYQKAGRTREAAEISGWLGAHR
jgi:tetratricopeptide (TPR) repeat protein